MRPSPSQDFQSIALESLEKGWAPFFVLLFDGRMYLIVLGRVRNSSGSGLAFWQSSGSGFVGFDDFCKVRVRVYRFGFIGFHGFEFYYQKSNFQSKLLNF